METIIDCKYFPECTGCTWIGKPYSWQQSQMLESLKIALDEAELKVLTPFGFRATQPYQLRDRADLTLERSQEGLTQIGFYNKTKNLVNIKECRIFSPKLQSWYEWILDNPPPIVEKGSFRIRVGEDDLKGLWLDFSNKDIKALIEEKKWLTEVLKQAVVEVGQRQKQMVLNKGELKLVKKAQPQNWFKTYSYPNYDSINLKSLVSSFTQPSIDANKVLIQTVCEALENIKPKNTLELFSGIGNLTIPLVSLGSFVSCYEVDKNAIRSFEQTLKDYKYDNFIKLYQKNLYSKSVEISWEEFDLLVVDPPRSGLKNFTDKIEPDNKPKNILYVSCFLNSLIEDLKKLSSLGYKIQSVSGVDQFPQSSHCEWVVLLES
ncbi:MAG: methyltransferase [Bdellovibrionales bacterium]|nr:methyltransferase [Bdellovibrionales bacterium]